MIKAKHIALAFVAYHLYEYLNKTNVGVGNIAIDNPMDNKGYYPIYRVINGKIRGVHRNVGAAFKKSGIYYIKEDGQLIYIGYSGTNLYKTILRHFQTWNDIYQSGRISYKDRLFKHRYEVKIIYLSPKDAELAECQLIKQYEPRDNKRKNFWNITECNGGWEDGKAWIIDPKTNTKTYKDHLDENKTTEPTDDNWSDPAWDNYSNDDDFFNEIDEEDIPF